jgi:hypothetical protein
MCAGLPHNHWQKSYIARSETFKMTCDDVDKIEKCIKIYFSAHKARTWFDFLPRPKKNEAVSFASGYGEDLHT